MKFTLQAEIISVGKLHMPTSFLYFYGYIKKKFLCLLRLENLRKFAIKAKFFFFGKLC